MTVSILGCGWFGFALGKELVGQGITAKGSTTSEEKFEKLTDASIRPYIVDFSGEGAEYDADFFGCDILVVSIPPKFRNGQTAAFIPKIEKIIAAAVKHGVPKIIYTSSTGVYSEGNGTVTELTTPKPQDESGSLLLQAEELFRTQTAFETALIRFGGLVGPGRNPGRFFAGKRDVPNGLAPVNLIHLDDAVGIAKAVIQKDAFGHNFNACSPDHPPKGEFYTQAATQSGFDAPEFLPELKEWKIVNSVNVPEMLQYQFQIASWQTCLFD